MAPGTAHATIMAALEAHDLGAVSVIEPLPGAHQNCPHLVVAEAGRFMAKALIPALASPPALEARHAFVDHLVACGLPVPRLCRSLDGRGAVHGVELYEYVPGEPCGLTETEAWAASRLLCELHSAAADFRPSGPGARRDWLTLDGDLARLAALERQASTYLPAPEVLESISVARRRLEQAGRDLGRADLPQGMVHGTFEPGNLLHGPDSRLWVTDFDYCHVAPLAFDLATACLAFGSALALVVQEGYGADLPEAAQVRVAVHLGLARGAGPQSLIPE